MFTEVVALPPEPCPLCGGISMEGRLLDSFNQPFSTCRRIRVRY